MNINYCKFVKMFKLLILILTILQVAQSKGLDSFVTRLAEKYPDWLANTGNDPSYVDTEPFILHLQGPESGLTAEISNIQVSGVLHYNLTVNSFHYEAPGIADWSQFLLDILIGGNETIITGNYQLNGTLNGNSILGKGTWTATPNPGARYRLVMEYLFFQFENHNDQTYLGLKRSPLKQIECHFWGTRTYSMNGLDAAGSEEQIKNTILDSYFSQRRYNLRLPLQGQFLEYVENAFESNPYQNIINDPQGPT